MRNMTNTDLAQEFKCSVDTVERTLTWAKRADIFANFEDKIVQELIPLAHTTIHEALINGNAKIAVEVFKGLNLLRAGQSAAHSVQKIQDDDLAAYIATKREKAQVLENTIEAETLAPPVYELTEGSHETAITPSVEKSLTESGRGNADSSTSETSETIEDRRSRVLA